MRQISHLRFATKTAFAEKSPPDGTKCRRKHAVQEGGLFLANATHVPHLIVDKVLDGQVAVVILSLRREDSKVRGKSSFPSDGDEGRGSSIDQGDVCVIHVSRMPGRNVPNALKALCSDKRIVKVGCGIKGDFTRLAKQKGVDGCRHLEIADRTFYHGLTSSRRVKLSHLCEMLLDARMKKGHACSHWDQQCDLSDTLVRCEPNPNPPNPQSHT